MQTLLVEYYVAIKMIESLLFLSAGKDICDAFREKSQWQTTISRVAEF